jgi:hypothetical protein
MERGTFVVGQTAQQGAARDADASLSRRFPARVSADDVAAGRLVDAEEVLKELRSR